MASLTTVIGIVGQFYRGVGGGSDGNIRNALSRLLRHSMLGSFRKSCCFHLDFVRESDPLSGGVLER